MGLTEGRDAASALLGDNRENLRHAWDRQAFVRFHKTAEEGAYILGHFDKILKLLAVDKDGPFQAVIYVCTQHFVTTLNQLRIHQAKPFLWWKANRRQAEFIIELQTRN
jgi:hypothetical protein